MGSSTPRDKQSPSTSIARATQDASEVLNKVPGAREAIQQRLMENPEYRRWLQQFGQGVLQAIE